MTTPDRTAPPRPPRDPALPASVRCYACARRQDPAADACGACGASFSGMCSCGALHSLYSKSCGTCGARLTPKRLPRSRHPAVRAARWGLLVSVLGAGAAVWLSNRNEKPAYALKSEGLAHFVAGRYEDAARSFEAATKAAPRDAQAWYNLAACYRHLGMSRDVYLPIARRASEIDPGLIEALMFLATCEREAGNLHEALAHARRASSLPSGDGSADRMIAEIQLSLPEGDVYEALSSARRAAARSPRDARTTIVIAECYLRLYGSIPPESFPPDVAAAIDQARQALADPALQQATPESALARAQLQLCAGAPADAYATALDAIERTGAEMSVATHAQLLVVRARALLAWRDLRDPARADLLQALEELPTLELAASIAHPLLATGRADLAVDVLSSAAARSGGGGLSAALAALRLHLGEPKPALESALRAVSRQPNEPSFALVLGDAYRANGDREAARAAYESARAIRGGVAVARIALLALDEQAGEPRDAAVRGALDELAPFLSAPHPNAQVQTAAARLRIAARDAPTAIELAKRVAEANPGSPDAWILLAEAHAALGVADSQVHVARALQQARRLVPDNETVCLAEAESLLRSVDAAGAVGVASLYLERHGTSTAMLKLRARAHAVLGHWEEASRDIRRAIDLDPTDVNAFLSCAEAEFRSGNAAAATRTLSRIDATQDSRLAEIVTLLRLKIEGATVDRAAGELRARGAGATLARLFLLVGRLADAAGEARAVLEFAPTDADATAVLVHALLDSGQDLDAAIAESTRAVERIDGVAPAATTAVLRARILVAQHRWADAYAQLAPFRDQLGHDAVGTFVYGIAALNSGKVQEGIDTVLRSLESPAGPASLREAAADALSRAAELSDGALAERCARTALSLSASHPGASVRLADTFARRGEFAASADVAERGLTSPRKTAAQEFTLRLLAASAETMVGDASLALLNLERAAKLEPASPAVPLLRGSACLAAGDLSGAASSFDAALRADPTQMLAEAGMIAVELRSARIDGAVARAIAWQESHPSDVQLALVAATQLTRGGEFAAAARVLQTARRLHPGELAVAEALVAALVEGGRFVDAQATVDEFSRQRGAEDPAASLVAARLDSLRPDSAERAVARARRVRSLPGATSAQTATAWTIEADSLLRLNRDSEAADAARAALNAIASTQEPARNLESSARFVLGMYAFRAGEIDAAIREFQRCVELSPHDADRLNNLAWVLAKSPGKGRVALEFAIRATEARPKDPNLWDTRAAAADAAEDRNDAEASRRTCLTLHAAAPARDPDGRARAAIALARGLLARGRVDEAIEWASAVSTWSPQARPSLLREAADLAQRK